MPTPFPVQPELTAIAIAYKNPDVAYIADEVMPRVPVAQKFKYLKLNQGDFFTVPDTKVGRKSEPNVVEFGATEVTDSVEDWWLDDIVPNDDIQAAANANYDPLGRAVEGVTNLVMLDREIRVANKTFTLGNWAAANRTTLAGTSQWSDYAASNPVDAILAAMDLCLIRPNVLVLGQAVWTKLRQHPKVVEAVKATGAGGVNAAGVVARQQVAELFEVNKVLVGTGWVNSAKKGQTPSMTRVWGKHCALLALNSNPDPMQITTWAFTAQFGTKVAGSIDEPKMGLRGSVRVRSGESVKEVIAANDLGYFFQNAIA